MSKKRVVQSWTKRVMEGEDPKVIVKSFLGLMENMRIGPIADSVKQAIDIGVLKANAKSIEEYIRDTFPHVDDLRIDLTTKMLVQAGTITEAVETGFSYVTLQKVGDIPAGTRVSISDVVDSEEEEGKLVVSVKTVEKMKPAVDDEEGVPGEKKKEPKEEGVEDPEKPDGEGDPDGGESEIDFLVADLTVGEDELDLYFDPESEEEEEDEGDEDGEDDGAPPKDEENPKVKVE